MVMMPIFSRAMNVIFRMPAPTLDALLSQESKAIASDDPNNHTSTFPVGMANRRTYPLLLDDQADLQPDELLRYKELIQSQGRVVDEEKVQE